jgi:hypothetical protein
MFPGVPLRDAIPRNGMRRELANSKSGQRTRDVGVKQMLLSVAEQWRELAEKALQERRLGRGKAPGISLNPRPPTLSAPDRER